ncbi:hypothetical protein ACGFOM_18165 [Streptomyces sp. NPDC048594]|uniref:hypothetical protein n=1 Tax=Streptomyces sp. NPDC048594 TaxID=3365575 RepID=UPI00371DFA13
MAVHQGIEPIPVDQPVYGAAARELRAALAFEREQFNLRNLRTTVAALDPSPKVRTLRLILDALIVPAAPKGGAR